MHVTYTKHLNLDVIILAIFDEEYKL